MPLNGSSNQPLSLPEPPILLSSTSECSHAMPARPGHEASGWIIPTRYDLAPRVLNEDGSELNASSTESRKSAYPSSSGSSKASKHPIRHSGSCSTPDSKLIRTSGVGRIASARLTMDQNFGSASGKYGS